MDEKPQTAIAESSPSPCPISSACLLEPELAAFNARFNERCAEAEAEKRRDAERNRMRLVRPGMPLLDVIEAGKDELARRLMGSKTSEQWREHDAAVRRQIREEREAAICENIAHLRALACIPATYTEATLDRPGPGEYRAAAEILRELLVTPAMVALLGPRGGGKTALAVGLLNLAISQQRFVLYVRALDFFQELRAGFSERGPGEWAIACRHARPAILVVDELAVRSHTQYEADNLTTLLERRTSDGKATILISNEQPAAFVQAIGESVAQRLGAMGRIISCNWPSFRAEEARRQVEIARERKAAE